MGASSLSPTLATSHSIVFPLETRNSTNETASVKLRIAWIGKTKEPAVQSLTAEYLKRLARYVPTESHELRSEQALLDLIDAERTRPALILLDSRGKQLSSEEFAGFLRDHQDRGTQTLLFAIGPADGFSDATRRAAAFTLSMGKMTLAHELARIILLEQIYRGFTILKGHPYHIGH
jgi:23S rRNA (pseudouridine1915-N3)-methyltransferase